MLVRWRLINIDIVSLGPSIESRTCYSRFPSTEISEHNGVRNNTNIENCVQKGDVNIPEKTAQMFISIPGSMFDVEVWLTI